jgi:hypothetical protein
MSTSAPGEAVRTQSFSGIASDTVALLGLAVLLVTYSEAASAQRGHTRLQPARPPDFAFKYVFGVLAGDDTKNVLNTFDSSFTKDMVVGPPASCRLSFTPAELDTLYWKMRETRFFKYPLQFIPHARPGSEHEIESPRESFRLIVRGGHSTHEVHWSDDLRSDDPAAKRLQSLFGMIERMLERKPEFKALPRARGVYQ